MIKFDAEPEWVVPCPAAFLQGPESCEKSGGAAGTFVRRDAGCDGLSRLHRTAIRQHFKFHLKPRDLVCIKKMPVHLKRFYDRHQCLKMGQLIAAVVAGWSSRVGGTGTTPRRGAHPRSRDLNFIVFRLTLKRMLNGAVVVTFVYR